MVVRGNGSLICRWCRDASTVPEPDTRLFRRRVVREVGRRQGTQIWMVRKSKEREGTFFLGGGAKISMLWKWR